MAFAIGDFFVHDDAVKTFLGRFGKKFFRDRDVFLRGKAEAINEALHLAFGLFDPLANLDFLFAGEQGHFAHLVHVHPNRIIQNLQPGIFFFLRFGRLGALDFRLVDNFDIQAAQLRIKLIQIFRREAFGQNVIDIVVSDVAILLGQMQAEF